MLFQRPIWGFGPNGFVETHVEVIDAAGAVVPAGELAENAHNYYLQLAVEYGVPTMLCLLALACTALALTLVAAYRSRSDAERLTLLGIAAGQTGFLAFSAISHPLLLAEMQAVYWILGALGVASFVSSSE
jgi:O-antigen ligase